MKTLLFAVVGLSLPFAAAIADAADLPQHRPVPREVWNWSGFYVGGHIGAGWSQSDFDNGKSALYGNDVRTAAVSGGMQAGYNWQAVGSPWVAGVEGELSMLGADGSNTCFATSGDFISANCRVRHSAAGSLAGRIGYAAGAGGRTLLYAKGGGAWLQEKIDIANIPYDPTSRRSDRFGWTVGAGIEHAVAPAWSVKLEYDYADFGAMQVDTPASGYLAPTRPFPTAVTLPAGAASVSQTMQTVKLGVNLKLGADAGARWGTVPASPLGLPVKSASLPVGTEIEVGGRVWYSSGRFQKDLGYAGTPMLQDVLISRLTYETQTASGELFGRIDTDSDVVIKGFVGGGGISHGKMHDEDWLIVGGLVPYSNTLSDPVTGSIAYATGDIGYDMIRDRAGKLGAFIGYNYVRDDKIAKGCVQQGSNDLAPCADPISDTTAVISERNEWQSLRVGINGIVALTDRLQLQADAAYLPFVHVRGEDNHLLRSDFGSTISPEYGTGQGVQLEAVLSYRITPSFSVGAGGRYWAMWATGTDAATDAFSRGGPLQALPVRIERFGGFLQASYAFDGWR